jgi:putative heme-binding domain-containing protein
MPSLARLEAAATLRDAKLNNAELEKLIEVVVGAGPLELPHVLAAFERSKGSVDGHRLVLALEKSPGLESLALDDLRRTLALYGVGNTPAAEALYKRLEVDRDRQQATLAKIETELKAGDAQRGREVFSSQKHNCTTCHTVKGQGGQVGPDLSQIGALRTKRDLLEAVVFPSANFARGYEPYVVTTRAGRVYPAGILRWQTADAIYLVSGDRSETRITRGEIESMEPAKVSIMPQGLDSLMSRQELSDLLAFLMSLK